MSFLVSFVCSARVRPPFRGGRATARFRWGAPHAPRVRRGAYAYARFWGGVFLLFIAPRWLRRIRLVERRGCAAARFGVVCVWCRRVLFGSLGIGIGGIYSRILCRV